MTVTISLYQQHVQRWTNCTRCPLAACRQIHNGQVVLGRGTIPAEVCFIGEAPGESEDMLGVPFVGPAGRLLDQIIEQAFAPGQVLGTEGPDYNSITYAITNLVSCIPRDEEGLKTSAPDDEAVIACKPRLVEFIRMCNPRLIIAVGSLARDWLSPGYKRSLQFHRPLSTEDHPSPDPKAIRSIDILHPSFILSKMPIAQRGNAVKRSIVVIKKALEEVFGV